MKNQTISALTVLILTLAMSGRGLRAGDAEDGARVRAAVLRMRDEVFGDCVATMQLAASYERNGAADSRRSGTLVFSRVRDAVFSDTATVRTSLTPAKDGRKRRDSHTYQQFYMANGRRCIGVSYEPTKSGRHVLTVSCDPRRTYEESFLALTRYVRLDNILSEFGPTGRTLVAITEATPGSVKRTRGTLLTAVYPTAHGLVEIEVDQHDGRDVLVAARLTQKPGDVYTSRSEGRTLAEVRDSVLGETPGGLTSVSHGFQVSYQDTPPGRPFATITVNTVYEAAGKRWQGTEVLRLTDYRKTSAQGDVEALRLPIPDGERVNSLDPEYESLTLAYRGGEVVRQVDGASLEQVAAGRRQRRWAVYAAGTALVGVLLGVAVLYARRRGTRPVG